LLLECAWETLENAGYTPEVHQGNIGVFAGASTSSYVFNVLSNQHSLTSWQARHGQLESLGTNLFSLSTRVSYKLNLHGPSLNIQTACSTALVAVHLACQSLLSYQCDMALAGGVSIKVPQREGYFYQVGGIAAPDGHCRPFDSQAQGTTFGSGVGMVALKRLEDAIAAGDTIHAVIKGSAINNDGSAKVSYTAPSVEGQASVILQALEVAGISPESIDYIEAHGTGTPMGDPIEVAALTQAFRRSTTKRQFCALGSLKGNIGHLDVAAGIAGLIKTVLMLKHRTLLPSINCVQPTPTVDWAESPFYVNTVCLPWPSDATPRRAGVSAFGFGGTNAHVLLEEAPSSASARSVHTSPYQLLVFSARSAAALEQQTRQIVDVLEQSAAPSLADVAFTLQNGRFPFLYRRTMVVQNQPAGASSLRTLAPAHIFSALSVENKNRPVVFLLPGQGAQYVMMAHDLYEQGTVFKQTLDTCVQLLRPAFDVDLRAILYPMPDRQAWAQELLDQTYLTQPILFMLEYALAQQWIAWGIRPQALAGHSIGEYVAACLAGVFTLEDALAVVTLRGRLVQEQPVGSMLSVSLSSTDVLPLLSDYAIDLAAINGPQQCVISGSPVAIEQFEALLTQMQVTYRRLRSVRAFHSRMMKPAMPILEQALSDLVLREPGIPFLSNVTGTWITADEATSPRYWATQLSSPVQFSAGLQQLLLDEDALLLEVGPGNTLSKLAQQHTQNSAQIILSSLRHWQQQSNDVEHVLITLGKLWATGVSVDWAGFWADEPRKRVPLPPYPFEHKPYWIERSDVVSKPTAHDTNISKRHDLAQWFYTPTWTRGDYRHSASEEAPAPCWLILADETGIGERIAQALLAKQFQVIIVYKGPHFAQPNETTFVVNPNIRADLTTVIETLKALQWEAQGIVSLWSLPVRPRQERLDHHQFVSAQESGLYSLLSFLQTLWEVNPATSITLFTVTADLYEVTGDERIMSEQAPLQALRLILGQEHPGVRCRNVDIRPPCEETLPYICDRLITELLEPTEATNIALRGRHRWIETFSPIPLEETITVLRQQGVYLIVGGLGQLGLLVANEFAQAVQAHIVLVDKRDLRDSRWTTQQAQVEALRAAGADVHVFQADVCDLSTMQRILAEVQQRWGALHGVLYAAGGPLEARSLGEVTPADLQSTFAVRAHGLLVLQNMLADHPLDFCIIVSSLSCVLGGLGHFAYTAGHVFMDAFVHEHNQYAAGCWTSVDWETWNLSGESAQQAPGGMQRSRLAMDATETISTFRRVLGLPHTPQVIISSGDLFALMNRWINPVHQQKHGSRATAQMLTLAPGSAQAREEYTPIHHLELQIIQIYQDVLGIEQIGVHDSFFEMGGDSLLAVQLIARLRETFRQELPLRTFFETPTAAGMASTLLASSEDASLEEAERILREIEHLTPEEIQALLVNEQLATEGDLSHDGL
jgi:acyl transferase domain-containing protein/acyl carrier protein